MLKISGLAAAGISFLLATQLPAIGPHEIAIIANTNSSSSVALASDYATLRKVPGQNIIPVGMPGDRSSPDSVLTPDEFRALIWVPVTNALVARGIERHVLAWVYSLDFPVRVRIGDQDMSLTGMTFMRNKPPTALQIRDGSVGSPLFAGPEKPLGRGYGSQTFDEQRQWLGDDMPLPSMMLGVTNAFANTIDEVRNSLSRGLASDGTHPAGVVYFITNSDVRSQARTWQFRAAVDELERNGVAAVITNNPPSSNNAVIGIMHGLSVFDAARGNLYPPGFIGEHLTSNGAIFGNHGQTRLSAWISAGATASSGTVTEPFAIWMKFPNARLFAHYTAGCTVIESFYQSIRAPLQILPVGDPLAAPWRPLASLVIVGLEGELSVNGTRMVKAVIQTSDASLVFTRFNFFLDGRPYGLSAMIPEMTLKLTGLAQGSHTLRCVASTPGPVCFQSFGEMMFTLGR